ncbi:hypothetical protein BCR39DRAFT_32459 [Naematelia encephala]|uniref:Uncharacterized protein n=1 Tax=Naematelia encephala TaxID=71784 RepID=A0A1Y2BLW5_9TREE|nr:hypothetical protein BCR39DRAFT_32459 [Naematelia encephala]
MSDLRSSVRYDSANIPSTSMLASSSLSDIATIRNPSRNADIMSDEGNIEPATSRLLRSEDSDANPSTYKSGTSLATVSFGNFGKHAHSFPVLPIIHLVILTTHLSLSILIPVLLINHLIQPLVLWPITLVALLLESIYLLPVVVLEVISIMRRRPLDSAWLQAGLHITIMFIALIPIITSIVLLSISTQIPSCPSLFKYKDPGIPQWSVYLQYTACQGLPKVLICAIVNALLVVMDILLSASTIQLDYKQRRRCAVVRKSTVRHCVGGVRVRRRWTTGIGELLWSIEREMSRRQ